MSDIHVACVPYCDVLVCAVDDSIGEVGMGTHMDCVMNRICLIVYPLSSMGLLAFRRKFLCLVVDGVLKISMRRRRISDVT